MRKLYLSLLILFALFGNIHAQSVEEYHYPQAGDWLITVKPQSYLLGFNLGVEYTLNPRLTWQTEVTNHSYYSLIGHQSTAFYSSLKWHVWKGEAKSFYLQPKAVVGFYYGKNRYEQKPYYAGLGLTVGFMHSISSNDRWFLFYELGGRYSRQFGQKACKEEEFQDCRALHGFMDFAFNSPGSYQDISIGVAYRF